MNVDETVRMIDALLLDYPELADDETLRADMVAGSTNAMELLDRLTERMQEVKSLTIALTGRIAELRDRRDRFDRREEGLRAAIFRIMQAANLPKAELTGATLSIRKGQPRLVIMDEADIPDEFFRIKREIDKRALAEALKDGTPVLGAVLGNPEPVLAVRVA